MNSSMHRLILEIFEDLTKDALSGHYPSRTCAHCTGEDSGYTYSQEFEHREQCVTKKIDHLAARVRGEEFLDERLHRAQRSAEIDEEWNNG
jgi:hypothetical protein